MRQVSCSVADRSGIIIFWNTMKIGHVVGDQQPDKRVTAVEGQDGVERVTLFGAG